MEAALWSLEERWKVSTQKATALFAFTSLLVIGACIAAVGLRRRRKRRSVDEEGGPSVVKALMESVRWSKCEEMKSVWQRPILMGDKCELPRFSGLILYDHKGIPLHHTLHMQEKMSTPVVRTTLRDLL